MRSSVTLALVLMTGLFAAGCDRQSVPAEQATPPVEATLPVSRAAAGRLDESGRGSAMPADAIIGADGERTTLATLQGRPVLVNLWATWCGPCVAELPTLARLAAREGERLQVVLVNQDSGEADLAAFLERADAAALPNYRDPDNALGFAYNSGLLPTTILYDADGREVWRMVGGYHWDSEEAARLIERAY